MASKDPAALFYIDKWLVATAEMDADLRGWYLNLILHQYDKKSLPNNVEALAVLANVKFSEFERFKQMFEQVLKHKFKEDETGRLKQEFATEVIQAREKFTEKRELAGKIGYFIKFVKRVHGDDYKFLEYLKNEVDFEKLDTKDEENLKQVLKQMLKLYININKDINNDILITIELREEKFKNDVLQFFEYDSNMLNKFIRYWTEKNASGKKMKFELEKTFEISKRLVTWKNNEEKFNKQTLKTNENGKQLSKQELEQQEFNRRYGTTFGQ